MKCTARGVLAALVAMTGSLPAQAPNQAPKGQLVVSAFNPGTMTLPARNGLPGGLFVLHARTPGTPVTVTGLPPQLTGRNPLTGQGIVGSPFSVGCSGVAFLPDGDLLVGEMTPPPGSMPGVNASLDVHRIRLTWSQGACSAQVVATYPLATVFAGTEAEVSDVEVLPNGWQALVSYYGSLSAPLGGNKLAILDLLTGAVRPVSLAQFPVASTLNALAVSANGGTAYLGEWRGGGGPGNVWQASIVPTPNWNATPLTASATMGDVLAMDRDNQGNLLVGTNGFGGVAGASPSAHLVDALSGAITNIYVSGRQNAVLVERNTGDYFLGKSYLASGATTPVPLVPGSAPWGILAGLAMLPAVDTLGTQSTCVSTGSYVWQTAPNPGGIPLIGSPGFSITMNAPGMPILSAFGLSLVAAATPGPSPFCAQLLLGGPITSILVPTGSGTTFTLPLGIPNNAGFAGLSIFAQSFHLVGTSPDVVESSPALCVTVL